LALVLSLGALAPACSALVSPDTNRLGGFDAGAAGDANMMGVDTGPRPDTGVVPDGGPAPDTGVDGGRTCPASCMDSVACTTDFCDTASGACMHTANDAMCPMGQHCSVLMGCVAGSCTSDMDCSDGNACNGTETCHVGAAGADARGCVAGMAPSCADTSDCTVDHCDPASGCVHTPNLALCDDRTDCTADSCGAMGCVHTPNNAVCNMGCLTGAMCVSGSGCVGGTPSTCMPDGNPCTSDPTMCDAASGTCLHPPRDDDGDGYPIAVANGSGGRVMCPGGTDCNDANAAVNPGATEVCNGVDDNCNGSVDEGGVCGGGAVADNCSAEQGITLSIGGTSATGSVSGNNMANNDTFTASCGRSGGRDAVYYVDIPPTGLGAMDVTISTNNGGTDFDTLVAAGITTCGSYTRGCNDDVGMGNSRSSLTICVPAAATTTRVHILMDGFDGNMSSIGDYQLDVTVAPHPGGVCG
jgi:hypothetical protein